MLANMEVPTAAERIQIARWSAIRDSCSQRVVALISEPPAGISQGLWEKVVEITEHNSQRHHVLMMALLTARCPMANSCRKTRWPVSGRLLQYGPSLRRRCHGNARGYVDPTKR
jgi:hypothetical protein